MKVLIALLLILAVAFSFRTHHKMTSKAEMMTENKLGQCTGDF